MDDVMPLEDGLSLDDLRVEPLEPRMEFMAGDSCFCGCEKVYVNPLNYSDAIVSGPCA
jgi:hypothetical protein